MCTVYMMVYLNNATSITACYVGKVIVYLFFFVQPIYNATPMVEKYDQNEWNDLYSKRVIKLEGIYILS